MAMLRPMYMQPQSGDPAIEYSAKDDRAGLLSSIFSREGVLDPDAGQLKVTQRAAGANFSVDIAPGRCAIQGDDISDQGMYLCTSTTVVNLATPAKPGSGTRVHRLIARVRDKLSNGVWTGYDWTFEFLQDTGSGTPAQPNSAITLALVTMTSSMTSVLNANIDSSTRPYAAVGTPARNGLLTGWNPANWGGLDPARPPSWSVNPDGWVSLGGWIRYVGGNFTFPGGFGDLMPLPADVVPIAGGFRDTVTITSFGPQQLTARNTGSSWVLSWWTQSSVAFVQNSTWISLEGAGWRR